MTPLPSYARDPNDLMVQRLRALGLEVSSLQKSGFVMLDHERLGMFQLDLTGRTQGNIWLKPALLLDEELPNGYGADILATHFPRRGDHDLILCENMVDGLLVAQGIKSCASAGAFTVACSTVWDRFPDEWKNPEWWLQWTEVRTVGSMDFGRNIQALAQRDLVVLAPIHLGGGWKGDSAWNWMEDWLAGGEYLLLDAGEDDAYGPASLEAYTPVDIHGAFAGGHLHQAITLLERSNVTFMTTGGDLVTREVERKVLRVLKSNRTIQRIVQSPAPPGTPLEDRILRLEDGTLISSMPSTYNQGSWSINSVLKYVDGKAPVRELAELLADILSVLRARVWLPKEADYYVLALSVVVSYVQGVFEAVPLLLATGPWGSGKSALGEAMASMAANGTIIARASAATISRKIDRTRGFVVLDDLEEVARKGGPKGKAQFTELIQILKLSYKKETATREVTEGSEQVTLNYYGVKLVNNTQGTDDILGSRMLQITTAKKPAHIVLPTTSVQTTKLRDELHVWAFSQVEVVAKAYSDLPMATDRSEEITASLRVVARLSGAAEYEAKLDAHLNPASEAPDVDLDAHLRDVVEDKIRRGDTTINSSETQTALARRLTELGCQVPSCVTPEWIGVKLHALGFIAAGAKATRTWVNGKFLRVYALIVRTASTPVPSLLIAKTDSGDFDGPDI